MMATEYQLNFRPFVQTTQLLDFVEEIFGLEIIDRSSVKELESYGDRNFLIESKINSMDNDKTGCSEDICKPPMKKFILKVLHSKNTYDKGFLEATVQVLDHLKTRKGERRLCFSERKKVMMTLLLLCTSPRKRGATPLNYVPFDSFFNP